jgi:thiol-disulfide isomerase/thioredoxin
VKRLTGWIAVTGWLFAGIAWALPPLDAKGRAGYAEFQRATLHRAFAIAPGGAWSWRGDMATPELAMRAALADCGGYARRPCLAYALDDRIVFEPRAWARAWRPYPTAAQAGSASIGVKPGQRFPDLSWRDAEGRERKVSSYRGRILILHFWGSWCPPCRHEMPDLHKLYARLQADSDFRFVFLPVREPTATSSAWLRDQGLDLPLVDVGGGKRGFFRLGDGRQVADRDLARAFPTSYVLDRNGIVLFTQVGPVVDWVALEPLLRDAARARD